MPKISDGKAINVVAPAGGVVGGRCYRISGWNGMAQVDAAAGETFAMLVDAEAVIRQPIPAGVTGAVGDTLYVPTATGQVFSTALTATATSNAAAAKIVEAKDGNNIAAFRLLNVVP